MDEEEDAQLTVESTLHDFFSKNGCFLGTGGGSRVGAGGQVTSGGKNWWCGERLPADSSTLLLLLLDLLLLAAAVVVVEVVGVGWVLCWGADCGGGISTASGTAGAAAGGGAGAFFFLPLSELVEVALLILPLATLMPLVDTSDMDSEYCSLLGDCAGCALWLVGRGAAAEVAARGLLSRFMVPAGLKAIDFLT